MNFHFVYICERICVITTQIEKNITNFPEHFQKCFQEHFQFSFYFIPLTVWGDSDCHCVHVAYIAIHLELSFLRCLCRSLLT